MVRRFYGFIRSFNGSAEVASWLKKVKLIAKVKKITKLAAFVPLFLEEPAFAVYDKPSDASKDDGEEIEKSLLAAFEHNKFAAYDLFRQRSWMAGEAVDVFLAEFLRLARLAEVESEELICRAFVCGLPSDDSSTLRAGARIFKEDLPAVVKKARVLMDKRIQGAMVAVRGGKAPDPGELDTRRRVGCMWRRSCAVLQAQETDARNMLETGCSRPHCEELPTSHSRPGKRLWGAASASSLPEGVEALQSLPVLVTCGTREFSARALINSGCSHSIISRRFTGDVKLFGKKVIAVDGSRWYLVEKLL